MLIKVFVILVLALAVTVGAYLFINSKTGTGGPGGDNPSGTQEQPKGTLRFLNSKQDGSSIIQRYKAYINGKDLDIEVNYTYRIESLEGTELASRYARKEVVTGTFKDVVLFSNEVGNNVTTQRAQLFETGQLDKAYNDKFFRVIRGRDGKDYLAVATSINDSLETRRANYLYIFDDNLNLISQEFTPIDNCSSTLTSFVIHPATTSLLTRQNIWYTNQFGYTNLSRNYTTLKLDGDKIYYLFQKPESIDSGNVSTFEERVYTIENSKLEYEVINTYTAETSMGDMCY